MAATIIDGKQIAKQFEAGIVTEVTALKAKGITPGIAVVLVGDNPASQTYVRRKTKKTEQLGIYSEQHILPAETSQQQLLEVIDTLNESPSIHGILVQLPLPSQIDEKAVIDAIAPAKDVDAFTPTNVGNIMIGDYGYLPCTPAGVMELIASTGIDIAGKECVVVGRSNIVGKPMALLLLHENGTVTVCHSRTANLAEHCRRADILVSAVGRANFITGDMIKPGAVVIDVGMNRDENGSLVGDVSFDSAKEVAGFLTPVPGGVGPMTIAMLMRNTVYAAGGFRTEG